MLGVVSEIFQPKAVSSHVVERHWRRWAGWLHIEFVRVRVSEQGTKGHARRVYCSSVCTPLLLWPPKARPRSASESCQHLRTAGPSHLCYSHHCRPEPVRGWEQISLQQDGSVQEPKSNITTVESVTSPLPMVADDSGDDNDRFCGGGAAGEAEEAGGEGLVVGGGSGGGNQNVVESMNSSERCRFVCSLWPYLVPLFIVYWSEYVMQAGAWTSFAFNPSQLEHKNKRDEAYEYFNFCYQWVSSLLLLC